MLLVQFYRSSSRFVVAIGERCERWLGEDFRAAEKLFSAPLRCVAFQIGGMVFEMEDKPEFKARVRDGQVDAMLLCEVDGLGEIGVLVTIEHAPYLVVGSPAPLPLVPGFDSLRLYCSFDELQRTATVVVYLDPHAVTVLAVPIGQIDFLSSKTLNEHEQLRQQCGLRGAPSRWAARPAVTQLRSPDVMSSAETSNSRCDRIGVAPYRPAR